MERLGGGPELINVIQMGGYGRFPGIWGQDGVTFKFLNFTSDVTPEDRAFHVRAVTLDFSRMGFFYLENIGGSWTSTPEG